jgi:hypothetical protein
MVSLPAFIQNTWAVAGVILLVNLPFGFWRAGVRKFTLPWFLAVHVPVPIAVGLRLLAGLGFRLGALPVFIAAFVGGQFLGGRLRALCQRRRLAEPSSDAT